MARASAEQLLEEARAAIGVLACDAARDLVGDERYQFVDVREKHEVETGMIPGAVHAARGMLEFHLDPDNAFHLPELASGKTLIFVCGAGGRATLATKTARDFGCDALCLTGGMKGWRAAGGEVEGG